MGPEPLGVAQSPDGALRTQGRISAATDPLIGAFPIVREGERETVLGFDDRHLDFRIVVEVRDGPAESQVIGITTLVRRRSLFGYLYLAAVTPFHKAIVPTLLAEVNERYCMSP